MSEHHHRYHSAPATDEYRANFDRIFRRGYVYVTYPLASSEESREATKEALTRSMAQSDYSEVAGSDAERRKHFDPVTGFALPGGYTAYPDGQNSVRVVGPGRGVFGQDGT